MSNMNVNEVTVEAVMVPSNNVIKDDAKTAMNEETIIDMLLEIRNDVQRIREWQEKQDNTKK
jgi:hypothetical protein